MQGGRWWTVPGEASLTSRLQQEDDIRQILTKDAGGALRPGEGHNHLNRALHRTEDPSESRPYKRRAVQDPLILFSATRTEPVTRPVSSVVPPLILYTAARQAPPHQVDPPPHQQPEQQPTTTNITTVHLHPGARRAPSWSTNTVWQNGMSSTYSSPATLLRWISNVRERLGNQLRRATTRNGLPAQVAQENPQGQRQRLEMPAPPPPWRAYQPAPSIGTTAMATIPPPQPPSTLAAQPSKRPSSSGYSQTTQRDSGRREGGSEAAQWTKNGAPTSDTAVPSSSLFIPPQQQQPISSTALAQAIRSAIAVAQNWQGGTGEEERQPGSSRRWFPPATSGSGGGGGVAPIPPPLCASCRPSTHRGYHHHRG